MESDGLNSVPNDEDFTRADTMMMERFRNLDVVEKSVLRQFKNRCPLYTVAILPHDRHSFEAYVFFDFDLDVVASTTNGVAQAIEDFLYEELERAGRGSRQDVTVRFEFDSNEN